MMTHYTLSHDSINFYLAIFLMC